MVVLTVATLLMIGVFAGSMISADALAQLAVLYVLPVMLIGLELGVYSGAGGAVLALVLLFVASRSHPELGAPGLAASGLVFAAAGVLAGRFSERMRAGHRRQERLLASGLRLARLEDRDMLAVVLAEELQQALDVSSVGVRLVGAPVVRIGSSADDTLRVPIRTRGIEYGDLAVGPAAGRSLGEEDRLVAAKLALQAAVAVDNQRLLASERERAALHGELEDTRRQLARHLRNVSQILDSQEAERREIARRLHEEAAQAMGAVLLGLQVLERDLDRELTRNQLDEVRSIARDTLTELRQLAVGVRPPSLDDLGLRAALEGLAEREAARTARPIALHCECCDDNLGAEVGTCAYRLAEDGIRAIGGSLDVHVSVDRDRGTLRLELSGREPSTEALLLARLATAHARLELIGGTLKTSSNGSGTTGITAELPLYPAGERGEPR